MISIKNENRKIVFEILDKRKIKTVNFGVTLLGTS